MRLSKSLTASFPHWLRLIRIPNLFTVPGDPLAGLFTAAALTGGEAKAGSIVLVSLSALLLYMFGMILNDICDIDEDAAKRPDRPLPSRQIPLAAAKAAALLLVFGGLGVALLLGPGVFATALMLTILIAAYNLFLKDDQLYGPVAMGLCRGFSFLLGTAVFGWPAATLVLFVLWTVYIAAVTYIASFENHLHAHGAYAKLPAWVMAATGLFGGVILWRHTTLLSLTGGGMVFAIGFLITLQISRQLTIRAALPSTSQTAVGILIRNLLFLQAGILLMGPGITATVIVILLLGICWPANALLLRHRFQSS